MTVRTAEPLEQPLQDAARRILEQVSGIVLGKERQIRLALACLLGRGHLLIEDIPGVGKTTLAHVLARSLGLQFQRVQFTSDLLPADIIGASVYDRERGVFAFHPGPVFAQLVLADEINRATPKTQSALLEAMEERQVTVDSESHRLPEPFFVIATQNPSYQIGTFPLPESQLDRFLMCISLGYPDQRAERALLEGGDRHDMVERLGPALEPGELGAMQQAVAAVHVASPLLDYVQSLLDFSRHAPEYRTGLSPRAGLALLRSAQSWALLDGRSHVIPEDVQTILPSVAGHRLRAAAEGEVQSGQLVAHLLNSVAVP